MLPREPRRVSWFSCGAASAVATKMAIDTYGDVTPVYCDTMSSEHPDNARFLAECEVWFGREITVISSHRYSDVDDVFRQTRYMSGIFGARCTAEMKKVPRFAYQHADDIHIFGYHAGEERRAQRLAANNPELKLDWVLLDRGVTKGECLKRLGNAGIVLPTMYRLGFKNNNCLGCVKATAPSYWLQTKREFPEVFEARATLSRELGVRLTRRKVGKRWERVFLDELRDDEYQIGFREDLSCGPECAA